MLLGDCALHSANSTGVDMVYLRVECYVFTIVEPLVCVVGLALNLLCLMAFARIRTRFASSAQLLPYLSALCSFDALQLLLSLVVLDTAKWWRLIKVASVEDGVRKAWWMTTTTYGVYYGAPLLYVVNYASIWTIACIAVERYKAICRPLRVHTQDRAKNELHSWLTVLFVLVCAGVVNVPRWYERRIEVFVDYDNVTIAYLNATAMYKDELYSTVQLYVYTGLLYVIPLVLLVILNTAILRTLYRNPMEGTPDSGSGRTTATRHFSLTVQQRPETRSAWMLITIITVFFVCHTGGIIVRWVRHQSGMSPMLAMLGSLSNLMFNVGSLLNPVLYFLFTRQFKDFIHSTAREMQLFTLRRKNAQDLTALGVSFGFLVPEMTRRRTHNTLSNAMLGDTSYHGALGDTQHYRSTNQRRRTDDNLLIRFCPEHLLTPGETCDITTVLMMHSPTTV